MTRDALEEIIAGWLKYGWSPFPVLCFVDEKKNGELKREKHPPFGWRQFQDRQPTKDEIDTWLRHPLMPYFGLGVALRDTVVVDFDQKNGKPEIGIFQDDLFTDMPMWTLTSSGGMHFFFKGSGFRNQTNIFNRNKERGDTIVDIRADGGMVVVGGSELWNTDPRKTINKETLMVCGVYETKNITFPAGLPVLPQTFINQTKLAVNTVPKYTELEKPAIAEGGRHAVAISLALVIMNKVRGMRELEIGHEAYLSLIRQKFVKADESIEEYERAWMDALNKVRKERGAYWPELSQKVIEESIKESKEVITAKHDMELWNLDVVKIIRIGDILRFELVDGDKFIIEVANLYSQVKFRTAYTFGTNKILPKINNRSFESLLENIEITDAVQTGASLEDIIKEILDTQLLRVADFDTESEAIETASAGAWAKYGRKVFFQISSLTAVHSWLQKRGSPSLIISALKDIGARMEKGVSEDGGKLKYWVYEEVI